MFTSTAFDIEREKCVAVHAAQRKVAWRELEFFRLLRAGGLLQFPGSGLLSVSSVHGGDGGTAWASK